MQAVGFEQALRTADLVITGEGRVDETTLHGKLLLRVLRVCRRHRVPVLVICGEFVGDPTLLNRWEVLGCEALVSATVARDDAMRFAEELVAQKTAKLLAPLSGL